MEDGVDPPKLPPQSQANCHRTYKSLHSERPHKSWAELASTCESQVLAREQNLLANLVLDVPAVTVCLLLLLSLCSTKLLPDLLNQLLLLLCKGIGSRHPTQTLYQHVNR